MVNVEVVKSESSPGLYDIFFHTGARVTVLLAIPLEDVGVISQRLQAVVESESPGVEHFEDFWSAYPAQRRFNKTDMRTKWRRMKLDREWPKIQAHMAVMSADWKRESFKYCPHITTYVNQRRWEALGDSQQPAQAFI